MLNSINDIKHCLYINLDSRPDRKTHVEKQLTALNIPFERMTAICPNPNSKITNACCCTLSHIKCLKYAKENNWEHVLIVEDDILFNNPNLFTQNLNDFLTRFKNEFDVCLVGGNNCGPYEQPYSFCAKVSHCQTTTGYLVLKHYYDELINNFTYGLNMLLNDPETRVPPYYTKYQLMYSIDKYWFNLQQKDRWYIITPLTVSQLASYSDIEKREVNYDRAMLTLNKYNK